MRNSQRNPSLERDSRERQQREMSQHKHIYISKMPEVQLYNLVKSSTSSSEQHRALRCHIINWKSEEETLRGHGRQRSTMEVKRERKKLTVQQRLTFTVLCETTSTSTFTSSRETAYIMHDSSQNGPNYQLILFPIAT